MICEILIKNPVPRNAFIERSDVEVRSWKDLHESKGLMLGDSIDQKPIEIQEYGLQFFVDIENGQKTGFYLDQRENSQNLRHILHGKKCIELFLLYRRIFASCLTRWCEEVISIDTSRSALIS